MQYKETTSFHKQSLPWKFKGEIYSNKSLILVIFSQIFFLWTRNVHLKHFQQHFHAPNFQVVFYIDFLKVFVNEVCFSYIFQSLMQETFDSLKTQQTFFPFMAGDSISCKSWGKENNINNGLFIGL